MKTHLIIIDPQNDFCDPGRGTLYVNGADADMRVLADFVNRHGEAFEQIHVTLDSHQTVHIAHPIFWINSQGQHPQPFTTISCAEVEGGRWRTTKPQWNDRGMEYVRALERNGRYQLTIWPPHCRIGTWGHGIHPSLADALAAWEEKLLTRVDFIMKGSNPFTEHYSAVVADVPDPADPSTSLNTRFIDRLRPADQILLAGEALSHCLANTAIDIAGQLGEGSIRKLAILRDTSSNVSGCESLGDRFLRDMTQRGMRVISTAEFLT